MNGTYNNTNNSNTCNSSNTTCDPNAYSNPYFNEDPELGLFSSIWIDNSLSSRLSVLGVFRILNRHNYSIEAINYGNLISTFNVTKPVQPAYVYYPEPTSFTSNISMGDHFQWTYIAQSPPNNSEVTVKKIDDAAVGHISSSNFTVSNTWHLLAHSQTCVVLSNSAQ